MVTQNAYVYDPSLRWLGFEGAGILDVELDLLALFLMFRLLSESLPLALS